MIPAIFLTTLKIIGITLLTIISIIIFLLLIILFVPIFYKVNIDYNEKLDLQAKVKVLFGIISVEAVVSENKDIFIKVFGFNIRRMDIEHKIEEESLQDLSEDLIQEENLYKMSVELEDTAKEPEKKNVFSKLSDKIKNIFKKIKLTYHKIKAHIIFIKSLFEDDSVKEAFKHSKKYLFRLLKHIFPSSKRSDLAVNFGLDDPSQTGIIIAAVSPFFPLYGKWLHINPNFMEKELKVNGSIKGHFLIGVLLWYFIRVYFNKNVKTIIKKLRNRGVNNG